MNDIKEIIKMITGFKKGSREFPRNSIGLITEDEGIFLYETARNMNVEGVIVEVGSWKGGSTICLALGSKAGGNKPIFSIDPHTSQLQIEHYEGKSTYEEFLSNIRNFKVDDVIVPIKNKTENVLRWWSLPISLLFIDGNHSEQTARVDMQLEKFLSIGGIIAFHDSHTSDYPCWMPAPEKIVNELKDSGRFKFDYIDSISYGVKLL